VAVSLTLAFAPSDCIDWPVKIKVPQAASRTRGAQAGTFRTITVLVTYRILPDDAFDALNRELVRQNQRIQDAKKSADEAEQEQASEDFWNWRTQLLKRVVVALPEGHGFDKLFNEVDPAAHAEIDEGLLEGIAVYRFAGQALNDAYWEMMNGGAKGN
jgi:hypothetical protein